jgi:Tannase and feruloyl esterase
MTMLWPQLIMSLAGEYPHGCELDAITAAAIAACDSFDGVTDGLISDIKACNFDPFSVVGKGFNCSGTNMQISQSAALVANATWSGPVTSDGKFLAVGQNRGADLSGSLTGQGLAATTCTNSTCVGVPSNLASQWPELFIEKGAGFNLSSLTHEDYDQLFHKSYQQFNSIIGTDDPDLSNFKAAGGKMVAYHGLADQIIPTSSTENCQLPYIKLTRNTY